MSASASGARHAMRSGFLGPDHQPFDVTNPDRGTNFLEPLTNRTEFQRQYELFRRFDDHFQKKHRVESAQSHRSTLDARCG